MVCSALCPRPATTSIYSSMNKYGRNPSLGEFSHRPDTPVKLTGRAATRLIALCRPRGLPDSTTTARSPNGHCAPTVKRDNRTCHFTDRMRRCAHHPRAQRHDQTRSTQRPDATVLASGHGLESNLHDRTRTIACDRTRRGVCTELHQALLLWVPDQTLRFRKGPDAPVANPNTRAPDCCVELTRCIRSNRDRVWFSV
jgi:hypothetical protein